LLNFAVQRRFSTATDAFCDDLHIANVIGALALETMNGTGAVPAVPPKGHSAKLPGGLFGAVATSAPVAAPSESRSIPMTLALWGWYKRERCSIAELSRARDDSNHQIRHEFIFPLFLLKIKDTQNPGRTTPATPSFPRQETQSRWPSV
jgi:hypothetical protein